MTGPPSARVVGPTCEELIHALDDDVRIVFDLDGTLYDTRDFERPALAAVANWLRDKSGLPLVGLTQRLWTRRESDRHRLGLFSDLLVEFGLPASWSGECLRQFHEHPAQELSVAHSLRDCLAELRGSGRQLALVSNGPERLQCRKIHALGLAEAFDLSIICGPELRDRQKPSPWAWTQLAHWRGALPTTYVGDDSVDRQFADVGHARFLHFRFRSSVYEN